MAKLFIYIGITVGAIVGAYIPVLLFHVNELSVISIIGSAIGSVIGLIIGYKAYQATED